MIKPIRSAADLSRAKADLAELRRTNQGGVHDDNIDVLAALIEQFERTRFAADASSPVEAIRCRMKELGFTPRQLEPFIGSRARVSEILSGRRQLSIDMIRSLHEGLGIPYAALIENRSPPKAIDRISPPAVNRLTEIGFEFETNGLSSLLEGFHRSKATSALHRRTRTLRTSSKTDETALMLWQAAVLKKSEHENLATFDPTSFDANKLRVIARLSPWPDGPLRAVHRLSEWGISTVILPALPGTFLDGAVMVPASRNPVIGLTLRHDRVDSFWFTLQHELAHIALHYVALTNTGEVFVDDMEIHSDDTHEQEADQLGRESLIPSTIIAEMRWDEYTTQDDVVAIAVRARVHVAIVAGRWQRDHQNYKKFARLIERGTVRDLLKPLQAAKT